MPGNPFACPATRASSSSLLAFLLKRRLREEGQVGRGAAKRKGQELNFNYIKAPKKLLLLRCLSGAGRGVARHAEAELKMRSTSCQRLRERERERETQENCRTN